MKSDKPVLLIEDDEVDVITIQRAFKELKIGNQLDVARDGEEALTFLQDSLSSKPCLILLDLNMPKIAGLEFLRIVKNDEQLKRIPIVVLTTSNDEQDMIESFHIGAAGYTVKPVDYEQFVDVISIIDTYWTVSELP